MFLEIITPEKKAFEGEVKSIKLPGISGGFEILSNHAPIISALTKGDIRIITADKKTEHLSINGGVIEMQNNKIVVLAD